MAITENGSSRSLVRPIGRDHLNRSEGGIRLDAT
jgi:hypothetical protein